MVQVSPQELQDFAGMLEPADFAQINGDMSAINLRGGMPEADGPNAFVAQWAPHMTGFATDLLSGIEGFSTIATKAADSFESTDLSATDVMAKANGETRTGQWSQPGELPRQPQPPAAVNQPQPPSDPDVDILAPDSGWGTYD
ncbi:hypothetical protein [Kribbella catacumbae]|uniref:hypothetical protein n=1 Tax=Kribbella catacumbae TaxID=460086 RepID=UPI000372C423|nr:hypothetical protein [Kribbella catacumbae]